MWEDFLLFVAVGFAAQLVDGAVGMAYGLTGTTVLLSIGVAPATASACVHAAEVFTTGASGISHWRMRNVHADLIWKLAVPGMVGGAVGAFVLASIPGDTIRPFINTYLLGMGLLILWRAWQRTKMADDEAPKRLPVLGLAGGFVDAIGGGGWGPMVASTLIGRGTTPRYAIGSVNLAEFFVTSTITTTFLFTIGLELWPIIAGLILGGVLAAPLAAYAVKQIPDQPLMFLVGALISLLSLRGLIEWLS
jgi:uncharacterized membrane protein YfcA